MQATVSQPFCYVNSSSSSSTSPPLVSATCVSGTCAGALNAVCPPRSNSVADVAACFKQVREGVSSYQEVF
jgi:hypothetical protein